MTYAPMTVDAVVTVLPPFPAPESTVDTLKKWLAREPLWEAGPHVWRTCYEALKPGAHVVCAADANVVDLLCMALRLARFELRDVVGYAHARASDIGWTPVVLARRPLHGTVTENVLAHGTGALNIDACRIATSENLNGGAYAEKGGRTVSSSLRTGSGMNIPGQTVGREFQQPSGRWPANIVHDGSPIVLNHFKSFGEREGGQFPAKAGSLGLNGIYGRSKGLVQEPRDMDSGSIARYFKQAPDVASLLEWLRRLVCPPNGVVLDPFA